LSFLKQYASKCLPSSLRLQHWKQLDRWGWWDLGTDSQPLGIVPSALKVALLSYYGDLQYLQISSMQDQALRDLIALCRQEAIPLMFYLMPEGDIFRGWYAPAVRTRVNDYLTRLSQESGVAIADLRTWIDEKYFRDGHHLYRLGATLFSRRFGPEVLAYLVQGKAASCPFLLTPLSGPKPAARPRTAIPPINGG
jgi:hypothetical protein